MLRNIFEILSINSRYNYHPYKNLIRVESSQRFGGVDVPGALYQMLYIFTVLSTLKSIINIYLFGSYSLGNDSTYLHGKCSNRITKELKGRLGIQDLLECVEDKQIREIDIKYYIVICHSVHTSRHRFRFCEIKNL